MDLKTVNVIFNDCYKLYKSFYDTELNDNDLTEFVRCVDLIRKKYNCKMAEDILIAVVDEIDRAEKIKHPKSN